MAADEEEVISRLKSIWSEVVSPIVKQAGGRVIKTMGDGFLAEFQSPVEAMRAALAIQDAMASRDLDRPKEERLRFRIGAHIGDVVAIDDDILGDAVNVAARLEAISPIGGVCLSRPMRDQIKHQIKCSMTSIGKITVKNMPDALEAWVIGTETETPVQTSSVPPAVVVMPFEEIGGADEFFADGVVDEITSALSSVGDISVIARQSAFSFKGRVVEVRKVGRELGDRYIVTGAIRRAGSRVRISVQLASAITGANLWSQRYDDNLEDLFELQDRLTHRCHILETGNDSYRFKASSEAARKTRKDKPTLTNT